MTRAAARPSDPKASAFVAAHAGTGKTYTLVERVTRLLLAGAEPGAILCVTYTKAGAAEMQRRLFDRLGELAVSKDPDLQAKLAVLGEADADLSAARALFARALETPGGLKILTIHAFCERLLRRFPVEAGAPPGFTVMDDQAADRIAHIAREAVAAGVASNPRLAEAYRRMSVALDFDAFNKMFAEFAARRSEIGAYVRACEGRRGGVELDIWKRCGFARVRTCAEVEAEAMGRVRWRRWRQVAATLAKGSVMDGRLGAKMAAVSEASPFREVWAVFCDSKGGPKTKLVTGAIDLATRDWLEEEQRRHGESWATLLAARVAEDTAAVMALGTAYVAAYEQAKRDRHALDFEDLVARALALLTVKADAAWVLYKLDGGVSHVLLDEAQDTAPAQWRILRELTDAFFHGEGAAAGPRTMFVVGDEKQSIFSFQGARPERLAAEAQALELRVLGVRMAFSRTTLDESRRSTAEILSFVDQVFADPEAAVGLTAPGTTLLTLKHFAFRGTGGCVDLWPLEEVDAAPEAEPLDPVDAASPGRSAGKKLAQRIAAAIGGMVARGEAVCDELTGQARPCRWGDFLILVRRRNDLFTEVIRALKASGAPVAGADRLALSEHGLYADLMALGEFARFPSDDLALAGLLRSPVCDVDEESLFDLAHPRNGRLWGALNARAGERAEWAEAARFLGWARQAAGEATPFAFYAQALNRRDGAGRSMRQRLLTRLGAEAEEALDGFLAQCLAAEAAGVRDVERFLAWMAGREIEIKRDGVDRANEVRVMTAHGAKGLEAPIVILPDTASRPSPQSSPLMETKDGGFLWSPSQGADCEASEEARGLRDAAVMAEYNRLLYVALTRARDRLIVCGIKARRGHDKAHERSWSDFIGRAFAALDTREIEVAGGDGLKGRRFGAEPRILAQAAEPTAASAPLPAWLAEIPAAEPARGLTAPSHLDAEEDISPAVSPRGTSGGLGRFRRGDIIHRLLQRLPDLPPDAWAAEARRLLARERDLTDEQRSEMAAAALGVLTDARFAEVFGPGSRPEVPIAGGAAALKGRSISGRIDRLVSDDKRVLVVDYKTNRPAPARIEDADGAYIRQMAAYAAVLADIFPARRIEAALVWTDGPRLMPIPEAMLTAALEGLAA